ncbi:MAG: cytochrome P450 [Roseiflexaceae bacterium]
MTQATLEFWTPTFKAEAYRAYEELRKAGAVQRVRMPNGREVWMVTRYEEALTVLRDPRFVVERRNAAPEQEKKAAWFPMLQTSRMLSETLPSLDPPKHTRLRKLVQQAFTPRLVEQHRLRIQQIADGLIDAVEPRGQMDLISDYANPLPVTVISELLGFPPEDSHKFRGWTEAIVGGTPSPERLQQLQESTQAFIEYCQALFAQRRANPSDDLISGLLQAEEEGDKLSEEELFSMVVLLVIAGHETTVNLIGNGMLALLTNPEQLELLRQQPELLPLAVEEFLRYDCPAEAGAMRYASQDLELGGQQIQRGDQMLIMFTSINRDEQRFEQADRLDVSRAENKHLAFGHGIHYCLGAPLARLEGQIAFGTLLRRLPHLRLAVPITELIWRTSPLVRGLKALPVTF